MKKFILSITATILILMLSLSVTKAQEIETLGYSPHITASNGYGGVVSKVSTLNGKFANFTGLLGGWYINQKLLLGASGAVLTNAVQVPEQYAPATAKRFDYEMVYFGLYSEYVLKSNKAIHTNFTLLAGSAYLGKDLKDLTEPIQTDHSKNYRSFPVVVEPGFNIEVNANKWFRIATGLSYRQVMGSHLVGLPNGKASGIAANVAFKFGGF